MSAKAERPDLRRAEVQTPPIPSSSSQPNDVSFLDFPRRSRRRGERRRPLSRRLRPHTSIGRRRRRPCRRCDGSRSGSSRRDRDRVRDRRQAGPSKIVRANCLDAVVGAEAPEEVLGSAVFAIGEVRVDESDRRLGDQTRWSTLFFVPGQPSAGAPGSCQKPSRMSERRMCATSPASDRSAVSRRLASSRGQRSAISSSLRMRERLVDGLRLDAAGGLNGMISRLTAHEKIADAAARTWFPTVGASIASIRTRA